MILGEKISGGSSWSRDDDIAFERALTIFTDETDDRWEDIAAVVPGKTSEQIIEHYKILVHDVTMIESGCVPLPDYGFSEETNHNSSDEERSIWECGNNIKREYEQKGELKQKQKRRRGIAWTANEHRLFLLGLNEYGKGDWRSISRNFVVTRTPTQVASHAQKYFARLNSKNKSKNRTSIHDVTVAENRSISTQERPITWQNININNVASSSNAQATSQPSLDNLSAAYGTPSIWNTQATSQPSLNLPMYGTPAMWNTQASSQPQVNVPMHGQTMVGPMLLPFGNDMNRLAPPPPPPPPPMVYGVQHQSVPYSSVPSAPINMGSIPYNMTYMSHQPRT